MPARHPRQTIADGVLLGDGWPGDGRRMGAVVTDDGRRRTSRRGSGAPAALRRAAGGLPLSEGIVPPDEAVDLGAMADSISFQLRHASFAVHAAFGFRFRPADAVPRQYSILYLIDRNPGLSVKALAAAIGVDQSTLVPSLNILEERGWILRARGQPDRRRVALTLTSEGAAMLAAMQRAIAAHEAEIAADLDDAERRALILLLRKVRAAAAALVDDDK